MSGLTIKPGTLTMMTDNGPVLLSSDCKELDFSRETIYKRNHALLYQSERLATLTCETEASEEMLDILFGVDLSSTEDTTSFQFVKTCQKRKHRKKKN